jgi:hypothetical protein
MGDLFCPIHTVIAEAKNGDMPLFHFVDPPCKAIDVKQPSGFVV